MPEYVSRKLVRKILGPAADQFDVMLVPHTPKLTGIDKVLEVIDKARVFRATLNEDEGVTYP